jgi:hypothetical protein
MGESQRVGSCFIPYYAVNNYPESLADVILAKNDLAFVVESDV